MIWQHNGTAWQHVRLNNFACKKAFIVCSGPSLSKISKQLNGPGRLVIGVNNSYPKIRPDIWCGMDYPECYDNRLLYESFIKIMRGSLVDHTYNSKPLKEYKSTVFARVDQKQSFWDYNENTTAIEWNNNSFTITLQIALWLGVRQFYFVGVDLNIDNDDYHDGTYLNDKQRAYNKQLYNELYNRLRDEIIPKFLDLNIYCVSCSEGSRLNNIMPYQDIDDAINDCEFQIESGRRKLHALD